MISDLLASSQISKYISPYSPLFSTWVVWGVQLLYQFKAEPCFDRNLKAVAAHIASCCCCCCLPVGESSSSSRREDRTQSVGGKRNVLVFSKHSDSHICIEALFSVRPLGKSKRWVLDVPVCWMLVDQACILGFHSHVRNLHLLLLKRRIVLTKSLPNFFQKKTSQDFFQMIGISKYFGPINTSSVEFHIDADGADTGRMCSSLGLQPGGEEAVGKAR